MAANIVLASGSAIRAQLLTAARVPFLVDPAKIDEESIKTSLIAEGASPRDVADTLAESKARRIGNRHPQAMVLGCDQVLDFKGKLLSKPQTSDHALDMLKAMRGDRHVLRSAIVIYHEHQPIWRHVGQVRLRMRDLSDAYLNDYVNRNWDSIRDAVGAYKLEEEGVRLFSAIDGDYFNVLGMPLIELLGFLMQRGVIEQ